MYRFKELDAKYKYLALDYKCGYYKEKSPYELLCSFYMTEGDEMEEDFKECLAQLVELSLNVVNGLPSITIAYLNKDNGEIIKIDTIVDNARLLDSVLIKIEEINNYEDVNFDGFEKLDSDLKDIFNKNKDNLVAIEYNKSKFNIIARDGCTYMAEKRVRDRRKHKEEIRKNTIRKLTIQEFCDYKELYIGVSDGVVKLFRLDFEEYDDYIKRGYFRTITPPKFKDNKWEIDLKYCDSYDEITLNNPNFLDLKDCVGSQFFYPNDLSDNKDKDIRTNDLNYACNGFFCYNNLEERDEFHLIEPINERTTEKRRIHDHMGPTDRFEEYYKYEFKAKGKYLVLSD